MSEYQDAIKIMKEMSPMLDPTDDYMTVVGTEEHMDMVAARRKKEMDQALSGLRSLSLVLDAAKVSSARPATVPSEEEHAHILNELDSMRSSLAKSINDGEGTIANKEEGLARLKDEWARLEASDPAATHELDGTALRMAIIRGLGFEPITEKEGGLVKMLIRSASGEVHSVSFDSRISDAEYADLLWKLASL